MIEINAWIILVQLISFLVLMAILGRFLFSPLVGFIEKRKEEISKTFSLIEEEKKRASSLIEEAERRLKETDIKAKNIIERAIKEGEGLKDEIIRKAKEEAEKESQRLILNAKKEIERQKKLAMSDISKISIAIASKLIKDNLDEKKADALLSEFIGSIKEEDLW